MPTLSKQKMTVFLVFRGNAEEAMGFYMSLFKNSEIVQVVRARAQDAGWAEGDLQHAIFSLDGHQMMCVNMPPPDSNLRKLAPWEDFHINPAMTIYLRCEDEEEFDRFYNAFSEDGTVYMPARSYGFSPKFAWLDDRYGVSWRLNLSAEE